MMLIEGAKLAPRWNKQLAAVHERELKKGNRNRATLAVARKLVAYPISVDRSGMNFHLLLFSCLITERKSVGVSNANRNRLWSSMEIRSVDLFD